VKVSRAPTSQLAITRFEEMAAAHPHEPALWTRDQVIDYRRLHALSDCIASMLLQRGIRRADRVALLMPRSVELVASVLGVWKAGACWVPLDLDWPSGRIDDLLDDCEPKLVLTAGSTVLDPRFEVLVVRSSPSTRLLSAAEREALAVRRHSIAAEDPAYVIYTSGSTGRPKGVIVEHRSLAHYCRWALHAYPGLRRSTLLHSPLSFDLSITSLIPPLLSGGTVHLAPLEPDPALLGTLRRKPLGLLKLTPSHLPLLDVLPTQFLPDGQLVVGGEQLLGGALRGLARRAAGLLVVNEYGPTEATVGCIFHSITMGASPLPDIVPIGRPAPQVEIHLSGESTDERGTSGELMVSGPGVARGYLGQPELTQDRFVTIESLSGAAHRAYRTGDIVRLRPDGNYEYVGRTDNQLKVRGHRIEPAEIEAVLLRVLGVRRVVVIARNESGRGGNPLVAYYEATDIVSPSALRQAAAASLPAYMVPGAFVAVADLPLSGNGKVDRGALPSTDLRRYPDISGR